MGKRYAAAAHQYSLTRSVTRFEQMLRKEIAKANVEVQTLSPERNEKQTLRSKGKRRNIA